MSLASVSNILQRMSRTDELEERIAALLASSDLSLFDGIHEEVRQAIKNLRPKSLFQVLKLRYVPNQSSQIDLLKHAIAKIDELRGILFIAVSNEG